jgi:hypothetical protein
MKELMMEVTYIKHRNTHIYLLNKVMYLKLNLEH